MMRHPASDRTRYRHPLGLSRVGGTARRLDDEDGAGDQAQVRHRIESVQLADRVEIVPHRTDQECLHCHQYQDEKGRRPEIAGGEILNLEMV